MIFNLALLIINMSALYKYLEDSISRCSFAIIIFQTIIHVMSLTYDWTKFSKTMAEPFEFDLVIKRASRLYVPPFQIMTFRNFIYFIIHI